MTHERCNESTTTCLPAVTLCNQSIRRTTGIIVGLSSTSSPPFDSVLTAVAAAEIKHLVRKALPSNIEARKETLSKLQRMLAEPAKVRQAVDGR